LRHQIEGVLTDELLEGRYRVVRRIATGGMAAVYEAEHALIGRSVAIKVLHPQYAEDVECVQRFLDEGRTAGTLGHPNIVESTDMGYTASGAPFLVLELLDGCNLQEQVTRQGRLVIERAVAIAQQIASALAAAHARGIIHRDLKSGNVFLVDRGESGELVKVLDFGISKFLEGRGSTQKDVLLGTPWFMSPEQINDPSSVDGRCDIYGLGVILYEMLSGEVPFADTPYPKLFSRILWEDPLPVERLRPEVGPALAALVRRAMARSLDERYATMEEVGADLAAISGRRMPEVPLRQSVREEARAAEASTSAATRLADVVPFGTPGATTTRTPGPQLTTPARGLGSGRRMTPAHGMAPGKHATPGRAVTPGRATPGRGATPGKHGTPGRGVAVRGAAPGRAMTPGRAVMPVRGVTPVRGVPPARGITPACEVSPGRRMTPPPMAIGPIAPARRSRAVWIALAAVAGCAAIALVAVIASGRSGSTEDGGAQVRAVSVEPGAAGPAGTGATTPRAAVGTATGGAASGSTLASVGAPSGDQETAASSDPAVAGEEAASPDRSGERVKLVVKSTARGARVTFRGETHRLPYRRRVERGDRAEMVEVGVPGRWSRRTWVTFDRDVSMTVEPERAGRDAVARAGEDAPTEIDPELDETQDPAASADEGPAPRESTATPARADPDATADDDEPAPERSRATARVEPAVKAPVRGALDPEATRQAVGRHLREVRTCFERGRMDNPQLAGRVLVRIDVSPSGKVSSARVARSTLDNQAVESCITSMVATWTLPAPSGGVAATMTYPFSFQ